MAVERCYFTCFLVYLFWWRFCGFRLSDAVSSPDLAPLGLQAFANEILFGLGVWLHPLLPSLFQEWEAQRLEKGWLRLLKFFNGSQFGLGALLSGLVQGLGSRLVYRNQNRYEVGSL